MRITYYKNLKVKFLGLTIDNYHGHDLWSPSWAAVRHIPYNLNCHYTHIVAPLLTSSVSPTPTPRLVVCAVPRMMLAFYSFEVFHCDLCTRCHKYYDLLYQTQKEFLLQVQYNTWGTCIGTCSSTYSGTCSGTHTLDVLWF